MMELMELLKTARQQHATDLLLSPNQPPRLQSAAKWQVLEQAPLTQDELSAAVFGLLAPEQQWVFKEASDWPIGFGVSVPDIGRLRIIFYEHYAGLSAALRFIAPPPLQDQLSLPELEKQITSSGLIVIQGGAGSGRSTSASRLIEAVNQQKTCHIVTVESPIEAVYQSGFSLIEQQEINFFLNSQDMLQQIRQTFPRLGIKLLYVDGLPDYRYLLAMMEAVAAGITVITTCHAQSLEHGLQALVDLFPVSDRHVAQCQLAESLGMCWHQSLEYREEKEKTEKTVCYLHYQRLLMQDTDRELFRRGAFDDLTGIKCGEVVSRV